MIDWDTLEKEFTAPDGMPNKIPDGLHHGIKMYFEKRIRPGGFLNAVLCNDLRTAISAADVNSYKNLHAILSWLYNYAPVYSWGSDDAVKQWISKKS